MAPRITRSTLGAWLLRCNVTNEPELPQLIAEGGHRIQRWCVARNYRSRMMAPGDAVAFWVSGDGRRLTRGIWGIGQVLGVDDIGPKPSAEVDIPLRRAALSDQLIRASGVDDLEVQVQPQGSNPSWISVAQVARLAVIDASLVARLADTPTAHS